MQFISANQVRNTSVIHFEASLNTKCHQSPRLSEGPLSVSEGFDDGCWIIVVPANDHHSPYLIAATEMALLFPRRRFNCAHSVEHLFNLRQSWHFIQWISTIRRFFSKQDVAFLICFCFSIHHIDSRRNAFTLFLYFSFCSSFHLI